MTICSCLSDELNFDRRKHDASKRFSGEYSRTLSNDRLPLVPIDAAAASSSRSNSFEQNVISFALRVLYFC
jgi:hypothetical protein